MTTSPPSLALPRTARPRAVAAGGARGYAPFLLATAALFVRPAEIVPALERWPIYEALIVAALALAWPYILVRLRPSRLARDPITVAVLGLLPLMPLGLLLRGDPATAAVATVEYTKVVAYYLLLIAVIDSPARLARFARWLLAMTIILAALPLLQYHGVIDNPALQQVRERIADGEQAGYLHVTRLAGAGLFGDPNDLAHVLCVGVLLAVYAIGSSRSRLGRLAWVAAAGMLAYAILLTQSRGGLLALLAGLAVLFAARFGMRRALVLGGPVVALVLAVAAGRQTEFSVTSGSGQTRIQLWSDALYALQRHPLFGIGWGQFGAEGGLVVHNSFLQAFTELGLAGGTLFLGAYYAAWRGLRRPPSRAPSSGLRPFLLAIVVSYAVGMMSLSRTYVVPTFMVLGIASAFLRVSPNAAPVRLDRRLLASAALASAGFLVLMQALVRAALRW